MTIPTREQDTESAYLKRVQGRLNAYANERCRDWDLYKDDLIEWLSGYRKTISKASWRQNRAALVWFFKNIYVDQYLAGAIQDIDTFACTEATKTSSNKKKSLSTTEIEMIGNELLTSHRKYLTQGGKKEDSVALNTLLFLTASEMTGLRPSEWWDTTLFEPGDVDFDGKAVDNLTLVVKNGKSTNGRSHGASRTLRFTDLDDERKHALLMHYRSVKQNASKQAFELFVTACRNRMTYTTRKLWPNRKRLPTLYSGRHQFSANLKKAKTPLSAIAALMGHATDKTATEHYGKKRFGRGNETGIEADPEEINRIRQVAKPAYAGHKTSTTVANNSPGIKR